MTEDDQARADGLALHDALDLYARETYHLRFEKHDEPGIVDGYAADIAQALRQAGWSPPARSAS